MPIRSITLRWRPRALLARGVAHGDRVAIWAPNTWRWVVAALGAHAIGAVLVPINTRYKGDEAALVGWPGAGVSTMVSLVAAATLSRHLVSVGSLYG